MNRTSSFFAVFLLMAMAASSGCASTSNAVSGGKAISAVEIEPNKDTLSSGASQKFRAVVRFADGTTEDVTTDAKTVWNTSDPAVATVAKDGTVTAQKPGLVDISASYNGMKGDEHFAVTP
jgi:uncharacterized protein YjdB